MKVVVNENDIETRNASMRMQMLDKFINDHKVAIDNLHDFKLAMPFAAFTHGVDETIEWHYQNMNKWEKAKEQISKQEDKEWKYPCLVIADNGQVVLALKDNMGINGLFFGVQIRNGLPNGDLKIGWFENRFNKSCFKPFTGTVTLSND